MRRRRRLALLVLAALLLRALIPAGFMPFAGAGGPHLGLCPGAGALPPAASESATHASHLAHPQPAGGAPHDPGTHHQTACVFSAGATTAFAAIHSVAVAAPVAPAPPAHDASLIYVPAILRAQLSRAPPVLA